jgi:hypothetical protein
MAAPAPVPPAPRQGFPLLAVPSAAGVVAGAVARRVQRGLATFPSIG